jgi:hypothetical protein
VFEIGNSLREARDRQQLDFPEIEYSTKIRSKYLRALEEEQFDLLPAQTYVKGFLRAYAEYLGLDGQLYVDEYNSRFVSGDEETPLRTRSGSLPRHERRIHSRAVLAVVAGIALVTGLVIAAWKFGTPGEKSSVPGLRPPGGQKHHVTRRHRPPARPASVSVDVRATHGSGSYLEVRVNEPNGRQLFAGTLQPGARQVFRASRLWLAVGAPANVAVHVGGKRRVLPGHGYPRAFLVSRRRGLILASTD